jgi:hypothetical protein
VELQADVQQMLTHLEDQGWAERAAGHGVEFYRQILADDGRLVFANGVCNKTEALEGLPAAPRWENYVLRGMHVIEMTDDSAAVVYDAEAYRASWSQ